MQEFRRTCGCYPADFLDIFVETKRLIALNFTIMCVLMYIFDIFEEHNGENVEILHTIIKHSFWLDNVDFFSFFKEPTKYEKVPPFM